MTDLERLFQQIVLNLAARDPALLRHPVPLAEIRDSIVPYRANRRALLLESSEDYEIALLRLCAGEGGYAHTIPREVENEFASELENANPDLSVVRRRDQASVRLDPDAVASVLDQKTGATYAPQEPVWRGGPSPLVVAPSPQSPSPAPQGIPPETRKLDEGIARCNRCGGGLPVTRPVNFCPHCGLNLTPSRCPVCQTELQPSWRHCVACGASVK